MGKFWKSMVFLTIGKAFGMTSPFILKWVVNTMTAAVTGATGTAATIGLGVAAVPVSMTLRACIGAVGFWGLSKLISITMLCYQMDSITSVI